MERDVADVVPTGGIATSSMRSVGVSSSSLDTACSNDSSEYDVRPFLRCTATPPPSAARADDDADDCSPLRGRQTSELERAIAALRVAVIEAESSWALASSVPQAPSRDDGTEINSADAMREWLPRCCVDDDGVLRRFLQHRGGDVDAAAKRLIRFCGCVKEVAAACDATDGDFLAKLPVQAQPVVESGAWRVLDQRDTLGRPVLYIVARHVDWTKFDVAAMKTACLFYLWELCRRDGAQTTGITCCMFLKGMALTNTRREYNDYAQRLVQKALPMRVAAVYVAGAPFVVRHVLWPPVSLAIGAKMRKRITWVSETPMRPTPESLDEEKRPFGPLFAVMPPAFIPAECGGDLDI